MQWKKNLCTILTGTLYLKYQLTREEESTCCIHGNTVLKKCDVVNSVIGGSELPWILSFCHFIYPADCWGSGDKREICTGFFLRCFNILCHASGFYMLLFVARCLWCARVRALVCVLFIGIVQRNWACLTWKSAIEIKSLLLLLLLYWEFLTRMVYLDYMWPSTMKRVVMCQAYFCSSKEFAAGMWKCQFWGFGCNCFRIHLSLVCNMEIAHFSAFHGQNIIFQIPPYCFNI